VNETGLFASLREELRREGLRGAFLARDLDSGHEVALDGDDTYPIASIVKVPLAIAVQQRIADGRLDGATTLRIDPGRRVARGPRGVSRFRHQARIAIDDALYMSVAISDTSCADALFELVPPAEVDAMLRELGIHAITVRHLLSEVADTPDERLRPDERHLAYALAIGARTATEGHAVPVLDAGRTNSGSPRGLADLLAELWRPTRLDEPVAARIRELLADNVTLQRLAPEIGSDGARWSSKTGTVLNLRHEAGVVEHDDGQTIAVVALTESSVPAAIQPVAEATIADVARQLHDLVRGP
jgi:beta-lactamase class A